MNRNHPIPPKWASRFLLWLLKPDLAEEVLGDLEERFLLDIDKMSLFKAKLLYWYQVLNYLRPFAIKNINPASLNPFFMWKHNLKISLRSFYRYKSSFLINLSGLSIGLSCVLLISLWIKDEVSMDRFHKNSDRLFQVMQNFNTPNGIMTENGTPGVLARTLKEEMPEIEDAASATPYLGRKGQGVISFNENHFKAEELYVSSNFLKLFSYPLLHGNQNQIFDNKASVVISESFAQKLFGSSVDVIGKSIEWNQEDISGQYSVTGVFKDSPKNSSTQFDLLFNYDLFLDKFPHLDSWMNSGPMAYVLLKKGVDANKFSKKIQDLIKTKYLSITGSDQTNFIGSLFVQNYSNRYLHNKYEAGLPIGGRIQYVRLFGILAIFILLIACINFMNLYTAQGTKRMKEIGVKKVIGAKQQQLIGQFMGEAILLSLFSIIVALLLTQSSLPYFNILIDKQLNLSLSPDLIIPIVIITIITGCISGAYPAFILSRYKPALIIKAKSNPIPKTNWFRKSLVVFQFSISILLIIAVIILQQQLFLIQNQHLGYEKENTITFKVEGEMRNKLSIFLEEAKKIPGVKASTFASHNLTERLMSTAALDWEGKEEGKNIQFDNLFIGPEFLNLKAIELDQGRSFSQDYATDENAIIFNKAAVEAMGLKSPIGQSIQLFEEPYTIVGITKNFNFESLYQNIKPCFMRLGVIEYATNALIKIEGNQKQETLKALSGLYQKQNQGLPFEYRFIDEEYANLYKAEQRVSALAKYSAGLAIFISCIGLLGLTLFTIERRRKELSIRTVLGASKLQILRLLSDEFTQTVGLAIILSTPLAYLLAKNWLNNFAYRIDLNWPLFLLAGVLTLILAWVIIGIQTYKVTSMNPVNNLKNE